MFVDQSNGIPEIEFTKVDGTHQDAVKNMGHGVRGAWEARVEKPAPDVFFVAKCVRDWITVVSVTRVSPDSARSILAQADAVKALDLRRADTDFDVTWYEGVSDELDEVLEAGLVVLDHDPCVGGEQARVDASSLTIWNDGDVVPQGLPKHVDGEVFESDFITRALLEEVIAGSIEFDELAFSQDSEG